VITGDASGDAAYNDVHVCLGESTTDPQGEWGHFDARTDAYLAAGSSPVTPALKPSTRTIRLPPGDAAGYPLIPWAMCPWWADSCSAWSSSADRCGLMSKTTFLMVPVNANGALSA
jgi:hypothetical protein